MLYLDVFIPGMALVGRTRQYVVDAPLTYMLALPGLTIYLRCANPLAAIGFLTVQTYN